MSQNVEEATKQLFNLNKPHLMIWVWIRDPIQPFLLFERPLPCQRTPLHYAAYCGFLAIVKVLVINHSQDVDSRAFKHEWTPLYLASAKGHVEVARWLIEHGASVTAQDKGGLTPLHGPSALSRVEVVRLLIEHGADVTAKDNAGSTPLHVVSDLRRVDVARLLVEHGWDATAQDKRGRTPLHRASARFGRGVDITRASVDSIDPTAQDEDGLTQMHRASVSGIVGLPRFLVEHGADMKAKDKDGSTPLHQASASGNVDLACFLVEHGADVTAQDKSGQLRYIMHRHQEM